MFYKNSIEEWALNRFQKIKVRAPELHAYIQILIGNTLLLLEGNIFAHQICCTRILIIYLQLRFFCEALGCKEI